VKWTSECESLSEPEGEESALPQLDERSLHLLEKEGPRFIEHIARAMGRLHRRDRLLLAMRYDQKLSLRELDHVFLLGSPERIQSLLARIATALQPLMAVSDVWQLEDDQQEAVLAHAVERAFAAGSQESDKDRAEARAVQQR
jgi:hypothetical protein